MPRVIVIEGAAQGLERCRRFLAAKAPQAARRADQVIEQQFLLLETAPDIGRPYPEMRELVIAFGDSGYVALYRHEPAEDGCTCWPCHVLLLGYQRLATTITPPRRATLWLGAGRGISSCCGAWLGRAGAGRSRLQSLK